MRLTKSQPSMRRTVMAVSIFTLASIPASLLRLSRPDFGLLPFLIPLDFGDTSPNFFICFAAPILTVFVQKEVIDVSYFARVAYYTAVGLTFYEYAQKFIPARTFDMWDIAAAFIGATASLIVACCVFLMDYGNDSSAMQKLDNHVGDRGGAE